MAGGETGDKEAPVVRLSTLPMANLPLRSVLTYTRTLTIDTRYRTVRFPIPSRVTRGFVTIRLAPMSADGPMSGIIVPTSSRCTVNLTALTTSRDEASAAGSHYGF